MRICYLTIAGSTEETKIRCRIEDPYEGKSYTAYVLHDAFTKVNLPVDTRKVYNVEFSGEFHDVIRIIGVNQKLTKNRRQYLSTLL